MDKKTPVFDWDKGDFVIENGVVATATKGAAVEQIALKALQTPRGKYVVYASVDNADKNHKYGNDAHLVMTANIDEATRISELKRSSTEALKYDPWITSIDKVEVARTGSDTAEVNIEISTIYDTKVTVEGVGING